MITHAYRPPTDKAEDDNATLLARMAEGDQLAWRRLIEKHERLVWSVAASFRLQAMDIQDVTQTTWLRLIQHGHGAAGGLARGHGDAGVLGGSAPNLAAEAGGRRRGASGRHGRRRGQR
jgi:hypothetical protein